MLFLGEYARQKIKRPNSEKPSGRALFALLYRPHTLFRRSSVVEQLTVNQFVVGSTPTAGATEFKGLAVNS